MDTPLDPSGTAPALARWAEVRAAERVTRYIRLGAGRPVVVLQGAAREDDLWPELLGTIAARCRVILPVAPEPDLSFGGWVRDFLDGLGLTPVALIAAGGYCAPALELALADTDRVACVVLVPGAGDAGELLALGQAAATRLLLLPREHPGWQAVARIERFIIPDAAREAR
ncbi:MAG TPA: hypothetical protein VFS05_13890 [Gemmatimonadaceae bacterium]|nr:hypothetical protein [Gemmatimonadaceae bacterium]